MREMPTTCDFLQLWRDFSDLPVQQSVKVELIINLIAAKVLGVTFPLTLLGRADEIIE